MDSPRNLHCIIQIHKNAKRFECGMGKMEDRGVLYFILRLDYFFKNHVHEYKYKLI